MKIYRYWKTEEFELMINGTPTKVVCAGASNESYEAAARECVDKAERIQKIVDGKIDRESDYEKPIREELIEEIDSDNIITRNRYGALVLNSTSVNIFDIDEYFKSFWEIITFKKITDQKKAIVDNLRKIYDQRDFPSSSWRIYETAKGIRLIVTGGYIDPDSHHFREFTQKIHADELYSHLCVKQKCYRARLTPKPARIGIKKVKYPCPVPQSEVNYYREWIDNYRQASQNYAVCRLIDTLGNSASGSDIIDYHDRLCLNDNAQSLA